MGKVDLHGNDITNGFTKQLMGPFWQFSGQLTEALPLVNCD